MATPRPGTGDDCTIDVIPYVCDQLAMARLTRAAYALMVALLPATATVLGIAVLGQVPSWIEVAGVTLVVAGVALHREPSTSTPAPAPATSPSRQPGSATA